MIRTVSRQGDGRFDVTWSGAAGENPVDLAIADLDEDGLAGGWRSARLDRRPQMTTLDTLWTDERLHLGAGSTSYEQLPS